MESIERKIENYAVVFNVNLVRATLIEATEFRDLLEETIAGNDKDIIVNLSACEHLDSTFLGVLVSSYKKLKGQNRTLVIIEPIEQSSIFLTLNSIGKIFPLYTNVKVALEDIENKKLLEKELSELSEENIYGREKQSKTPHPVEPQPLPDLPMVQRQEELQNFEPELTEETIEQTVPEVMNDSELISESQIDFNLTESNVNEEVLKTDTIKTNTLPHEILEHVEETKITEYNEEVIQEDNFIPSTPEVTRPIRDFHTGKVEWEFGFSS